MTDHTPISRTGGQLIVDQLLVHGADIAFCVPGESYLPVLDALYKVLVATEHDEIIPRTSTEDLYTCFARGVASLQVIPGVGHNTISQHPLYLQALSTGL